MNRSGIGIGSASVVLVFAVLCLTVFAVISYTSAAGGKALSDVEASLVKSYYEADTIAECILAELLTADTIPDSVRGVEVTAKIDPELAAETVEFSCAVSDGKELNVRIALYENSYDILNWRMRNTGTWQIDDDLPVWTGE